VRNARYGRGSSGEDGADEIEDLSSIGIKLIRSSGGRNASFFMLKWGQECLFFYAQVEAGMPPFFMLKGVDLGSCPRITVQISGQISGVILRKNGTFLKKFEVL
jgi:hypothetical protein